MNLMVYFILVAIIIFGLALLLVISVNKKGFKKLDVEKYRIKYLQIENSLKNGDEVSYRMSVIDADKLLDQVLKDLGVKGKTMGDRLKNGRNRFKDNNDVWNAHKLRNRIVHEEVELTYRECNLALANFKRALRDLGAI